MNKKKPSVRELYQPINIKFATWEANWLEVIRSTREMTYPEFSFEFNHIEKYCKTELEPDKAMDYLRYIYARITRKYKSDDASEQ